MLLPLSAQFEICVDTQHMKQNVVVCLRSLKDAFEDLGVQLGSFSCGNLCHIRLSVALFGRQNQQKLSFSPDCAAIFHCSSTSSSSCSSLGSR